MGTVRTAKLKIKKIDPKIKSFYDDLQEDFQKNIELFLKCSEIGYQDDFGNIVLPSNSDVEIKKLLTNKNCYNQINHQKVKDFIKKMVNDPTMTYGAFYSEKSVEPEARRTFNRIYKIYKNGVEKFKKENPYLNHVSDNFLNNLYNLLKENHDDNLEVCKNNYMKIWDDQNLGKVFLDQSNYLPNEICQLEILNCKRPHCARYCITLNEMIVDYLLSYHEIQKMHVEKVKDLKSKIDENNNCFIILKKLQEDFVKNCIYFDKKKIFNCLEGKSYDKLKDINNIISKPEYSLLFNIYKNSDKEFYKSLDMLNYYNKLKSLKEYPRFPNLKKNQSVRFIIDLFGIKDKNKIEISSTILKESENKEKTYLPIEIYPSNYLFNPVFDNSKENQKGKKISYKITFQKKKNYRGRNNKIEKIGPEIAGEIKEISLHKIGSEYFINYPINIETKKENFYFHTAAINKKQEITEDKFNVGAVDLNINPPAVISFAEINKDLKDFEFQVDGVGGGKFLKQPIRIGGELEFENYFKDIKSNINKCKISIDDYSEFTDESVKKDSQNFNISKENKDFLFQILEEMKINKKIERNISKKHIKLQKIVLDLSKNKGDKFNYRLLIDSWMGYLDYLIHEIHFKLRNEGYKNLSDLIKLIETIKKHKSLKKKYTKVILTKKEDRNKQQPFLQDNSLLKLKELYCQRLASKVRDLCLEKNVKFLFLENLSMKQDGDNYSRENTLTALFSPRLLIKSIQDALQICGIQVIDSVDPAGTSKTDPLNGNIGARGDGIKNKYGGYNNKEKIHFLRENKIVLCDSDEIASMNILLKGINRSVGLYKFYVKDGLIPLKKSKDKNVDNSVKEMGARMTEFCKRKSLKDKTFFLNEVGNLILSKQSNLNKYTGYVYPINNNFYTEKEHIDQENNIRLSMDQYSINEEPCFMENKKYNNFSI